MNDRDIENRLKILFQQLKLMDKYRESFEKKFGKEWLKKYVDNALDEIIQLQKKLKRRH